MDFMTKNEKKMMLALAKCLVHQLDVNLKLINMLPKDKVDEIMPFQDSIESELDTFIKFVRDDWNSSEEG
jgi:hypothetical protein